MPLALSYPNRFSAASLSGIGWTTGLPLSFLTTRQISQVARAVRTRGTFYAAWPAAIEAGVIGMAGHNLTTAGTWRVRGFGVDPRPALHLDFTLGLPAGLTCTRASDARFFGSNGLLQTAGSNVARIQHDSTGTPLGLLVEAAATNALLWARDMTQGAWTKTNASAALTATGIDGAANSASRITASAATARVSATHAVGATPFVFSVYLRRVSGSGPVRLTTNGFIATTVVTLTTSWQRFELVSPTGDTVAGIQLDTSGDVIEADFAQVELGSVASSPILTAGSTATRQGDQISVTPTGLTLTGALVVHGTLLRLPASTRPLVQISNGSADAAIRLTSAGVPTAEYQAGTLQASITTAAITVGGFRLGFSYGANDYRFSSAGVAGTPDTSGTANAAAATTLTLGDSTDRFGVIISELRAYTSVRTAADLNALATAEFEHVASYDSGTVSAWPSEWVSGTTAEERAGVRGTAILSPGSAPSAQWWRIDLADSGNTAGFVEAGRFFFGSRWRPLRGALSGARLGYIDRSTSVEADSGAEYFVERPLPRTAEIDLALFDEAAAMSEALEIQRQLGTTGEVLFQWDDSDRRHQPARSWLGRLQEVLPLTCVGPNHWLASYKVKELL